MGLIKITFDGSNVTSKQDADINYHLTGLVDAGVITNTPYTSVMKNLATKMRGGI